MIFDPQKLLLLAGPCSLESKELALQVATFLKKIADAEPRLNLVFKGSFDKANRTSLSSDRGNG